MSKKALVNVLVQKELLSAGEVKYISNHELLKMLIWYYGNNDAVKELFEIARNYYEDDKQKGINELGAINYTKAT